MQASPDSKSILPALPEKPSHYMYLKEFRVEQCTQFLQHKCTHHRPYNCFYWHFKNQKRRRPIRKRDGTFNYSSDEYCSKYQEDTGVCPNGDDCQYLHRNAGDTERRYHLRFYKTASCMNDTDNRGICSKNGMHCAFAHGNDDLRPPVYDIQEIRMQEQAEQLEKALTTTKTKTDGDSVFVHIYNDRVNNPNWHGDTAHILAFYKTDGCKKHVRVCRQGYTCPHFHGIKDRRRAPDLYKYRAAPCPHVKQGDEWGDPGSCPDGDRCTYCHTRTEQQFHPEIYKSTKCNDIQSAGYCPRGNYCAFAHDDVEMQTVRNMALGLEEGKSMPEILAVIALKRRLRKEKEQKAREGLLALQGGRMEEERTSPTSKLMGQVEEAAAHNNGSAVEADNNGGGKEIIYGSYWKECLYRRPMSRDDGETPTYANVAASNTNNTEDKSRSSSSISNGCGIGGSGGDGEKVATGLSNKLVHPSPVRAAAQEFKDDSSHIVRLEEEEVKKPLPSPIGPPPKDNNKFHGGNKGTNGNTVHESDEDSSAMVEEAEKGMEKMTMAGGNDSGSGTGNNNCNGFFEAAHQNCFQRQQSYVEIPLTTGTAVLAVPDGLDKVPFFAELKKLLLGAVEMNGALEGKCKEYEAGAEHWRMEWSEMANVLARKELEMEALRGRCVDLQHQLTRCQQERDERLLVEERMQQQLMGFQLQQQQQHSSMVAGDLGGENIEGLGFDGLKDLLARMKMEQVKVENMLLSIQTTKCMICEERERSVMLPCQHYVLCEACKYDSSSCPFCGASFSWQAGQQVAKVH